MFLVQMKMLMIWTLTTLTSTMLFISRHASQRQAKAKFVTLKQHVIIVNTVNTVNTSTKAAAGQADSTVQIAKAATKAHAAKAHAAKAHAAKAHAAKAHAAKAQQVTAQCKTDTNITNVENVENATTQAILQGEAQRPQEAITAITADQEAITPRTTILADQEAITPSTTITADQEAMTPIIADQRAGAADQEADQEAGQEADQEAGQEARIVKAASTHCLVTTTTLCHEANATISWGTIILKSVCSTVALHAFLMQSTSRHTNALHSRCTRKTHKTRLNVK